MRPNLRSSKSLAKSMSVHTSLLITHRVILAVNVRPPTKSHQGAVDGNMITGKDEPTDDSGLVSTKRGRTSRDSIAC